tara:strand:+ start:1895 stop:3046 length:1152 start_codon:yes stop_codon:yes gene_type:complete
LAIFNVKRMDEMSNLNKLCFVSNSGWALYNFRSELMKHLEETGYLIECVTYADKFSSKLEHKTYPILGHPHSTNILYELTGLIRLSFFFIRKDYSLIMAYTVRSCLEISLVNLLIKRPLILSITGLGILNRKDSNFLRTILLIACRWLFKSKHIKRFVFQSENDREFFLNNGLCKKEQTSLVPGSGVNLTTHKKSFSKFKDTFTFLHMSRLLKSKGVKEFCEAAEELKSHNVRFLLAGELEKLDKDAISEEFINKHIRRENIEYLGFVDNIPDLLSHVNSIVLLTTYPEGIPRSLIEAAASGKILISSKQPGCMEIVKNGYNGYTIDVNKHSLISCMKDLLDLPLEQKVSLSKNSRELAREKFDINIVNGIYEKIIKDSIYVK